MSKVIQFDKFKKDKTECNILAAIGGAVLTNTVVALSQEMTSLRVFLDMAAPETAKDEEVFTMAAIDTVCDVDPVQVCVLNEWLKMCKECVDFYADIVNTACQKSHFPAEVLERAKEKHKESLEKCDFFDTSLAVETFKNIREQLPEYKKQISK